METKSFISKLDKVSSPEEDYLVVYRVNGNFRAFNYLVEHTGRYRVDSLGDLKIMMESSIEVTDQGDFWNDQQDWEIVTWRLYEAFHKKIACGNDYLKSVLWLDNITKELKGSHLNLASHGKSWLVQDSTYLVKDDANPLMADSLPKTIWLSIHLVVYNEELATPGQTATGKESSNPFMAGSLPKTIHFCDLLQSDEDSFDHIKLMILCTNFLIMVHDLENLKTSHLLKKEFLQMYPNRGGLN
ncbi:hypothetical protein Tco_0438088 [Tanacetum coccineum]